MTALTPRLRALALVIAGALAFAIVPAGAAHASGPGSATFTVTTEGSPTSGLDVTLWGPDFAWGPTDASGQISFSDLALGDYTLYIPSTPAYQQVDLSFSLTAEAPSWQQAIDRVPWPVGTGAIDATITDLATGDPLPGVTVYVSRSDAPSPQLEAVTDSDGHVALTDLAEGAYQVAVIYTPTHFPGYAQVDVIDGATATVALALLAADSVITGRVVDQDGNGVPGLWVGASTVSGPLGGSTGAQLTDADGYYTLSGAGAGLWEVSVPADTNWERAAVTLEVQAASTATAPDLVLVARFTGTISGLVASSDGVPELQNGGFFDVCITALQADGTAVTGAETITGGDGFFYFWLAPGDYTVLFEDCDPDRDPHGYQSTYLGGSTTLAGATIVSVETNVDAWLDTTVLQPQLTSPEPTDAAVPVRARDLQPADEDLIDAPAAVSRGEAAEIVVGTEYAGQWVSAWIHPHATQLGGWHLVSPQGTIEITVPTHHPVGRAELVVQNADDEVIGWTELRVLQRAK
jgi:hypothetical protein